MTRATILMTLEVTYELNGETTAGMQDRLDRMVLQAVGEGLLTGSSDAEVESWAVRFDAKELP